MRFFPHFRSSARRGLAIAGLSALPLASAFAGAMTTTPELRQAAMSACTTDVLRLCPSVLFDEERIFACMGSKRAELTPGCRAVFDRGAKTVRHY